MTPFYYILLHFLLSASTGGASGPAPACGTEELAEGARAAIPTYALMEERLERLYQRSARQNEGRPQRSGQELLTLPVVAHIVHQGGPENIPDAQVHDALARLNDAFRNQGAYHLATGADVEIQFCLAQRDPGGSATNGIVRHTSPLTDMSAPNSQAGLTALATWDPHHYINIRIVRQACLPGNCSPAGYAYYPSAHGLDIDGIVIEAAYLIFGLDNISVLAHEMGHYLGLRHTFAGGCPNADCLVQGDRVCDTPPDQSNGPFPCGLDMNSCATDADDPSPGNPFRSPALGGLGDQPDMHQNYMDYGYLPCLDRFTPGQGERMRFFAQGARGSLLSSRACLPPCPAPVGALFSLAQDSVEAGQSIATANMSVNANAYRWYVNDSLASQAASPVLAFPGEGSYTVRLEAEGPLAECAPTSYERTVTAYCRLTADFAHGLQAGQLRLDAQGLGADSLRWELTNSEGATVFTSGQPLDSFTVGSLDFVQACLTAWAGGCQRRACRQINLTPGGTEICGSGLDDDGDGLAGAFDPDCPCGPQLYQAQCPLACQQLPDSFPNFQMELKWTSEIISNNRLFVPDLIAGDIDGDGQTEIVFKSSFTNCPPPYNCADNRMKVLNGGDGQIKAEFTFPTRPFLDRSPIAIADVDGDGQAEIFSRIVDTVYCLGSDGQLRWRSDPVPVRSGLAMLGLADFNGDGRPELYISDLILDARTGRLLATGGAGRGCMFDQFGNCSASNPVAADLLPSPGLELAAGNVVYEVNIVNINGTAGNSMTPVHAPPSVSDGLTSVADVDGDGQLEVIVVEGSNSQGGGGIFVWDPRAQSLLASASAGEMGGAALVGDLDGDCLPEIIMTFRNELRAYRYNGTTALELLYSLPVTDQSGRTGVTMFDFNRDGRQEIVYRDELSLRVMEGATGAVLAAFPLQSGTNYEQPIIVDVDGDGQAEILIDGHQGEGPDREVELRVYCFGASGAPWAPARSVWNQYAYNVTNINDDLTVPRWPQLPSAVLEDHEGCLLPTCPAPYNNYLAQATYRTQAGCLQFPAADLYLEVLSYSCTPDSFTVCAAVGNAGSSPVARSVTITCYGGDPRLEFQEVLESFELTFTDTLGADTICITSPQFPGVDSLFLSIGDPGILTPFSAFPLDGIVECDYSNNVDGIPLGHAPLSLDLGPDIAKCGSQAVTLNAGSGFASYLWGDGSSDSLYTSSLEGLHAVTATDGCGRAYMDSVRFDIDQSGDVDLGPPLQACPGEVLGFSAGAGFDYVRWLPAWAVDCDSCASVAVVADSSFSLIAVAGRGACFSADTVQITVASAVEIPAEAFICEGDTLHYQGRALHQAGEYRFPFAGCDSVEVLRLGLLSGSAASDTLRACQGDSVLVFGQWASTPGTYQQSFTAANGCDSIHTSVLEAEELPRNSAALSACQGGSALFRGQWLDAPGTYELQVPAASGCDTLYQVTVSELGAPSVQDTLRICEGDSVLVFGQWASTPGTFQQAFTAANGCDSLHTFLVETEELHRASVALSACPGGSVLFRGQWLDAPGTYELQVPAASGCDTLYQATVSELGAPSVLDTLRICEGDSVLVFGQWASTPGTYQQAFTAANGCDSLHTFLVEVEELHRASVALSACPGGSVLFRGQWLDAPGTYELQVPAASGCDTLYQATVSELGTYSVLDTLRICEGDSVLVFGQWASTPGAYQQSFTAANGCDSLHTFLVEVGELHRASVALSACPGGSVLFQGQLLSAPGTYELQVPAASGCDTLYQATVSELGTYSVQDTLRICEGDSVLVFGQWASTPDTFQQAFTAANGCDSLHTFLVEVEELHRASVALSACPGGSVLFRGQWLDAPGTYELQVPAVSGCDTLYQATVSELGAPSVLDTIRICEGDSVLVFGQWASTPGTYQQAFTAANGCDSLHTFLVEVGELHRASVALSACPGGSVLFRGQWLDAPGTYELQVPAVSGCDTLYQITVSELGTYSVQDTLRICEGDSVLVFGQWASTPGTYQQAFTAANGCDSLHTFLVEVEELHRASVALSACPGGSVLFRGQWLDAPGTYELQVPAASGCDTLYQATVSELGTYSVQDTLRICQGDSVLVFGQWASTPGTFQQAFTAANGCDSLHTFLVEVEELHRASVALSACPGGSVLFRGQWLDAPGTYELQVPAASGCDTLYQATVSELGTYSVQDTLRICQGDSVLVFGQWASTPGTYQQAFTAANGCDSLHTFLVEVEALHRASAALSACPGESVLFHGQWLDAPGTYELQVPAVSGCDTLYQATVSELGLQSTYDTLQLCAGDSLWLHGRWATAEGSYLDTLPGSPCPVLAHTWVQAVSPAYSAEAIELCPGDSVLVGGQWVNAPGEWALAYTSASGCDSLHQVTVTAIAEPPPPNYEADCEALEIRAWTGAPPIWGAEWGNGSTERQAVFPGGATARLALRTASGCAIEYELALPRLPEAGDIPALPDTAVLAGGALAIQLGLDPAEWSVFWTPPQAFSCDTCLSTLLYADAGLWAMGHFVHDSGCAYEAGFRLRVEAPSSLYVPSAFSPNGDGVNDRFQAYGWEVEVRSLKIFDRWGGLLCHSTGSAPYWDGTAHGQAAQTGVYVYLIEYTDLRSGKPGVASGDLMLLR